MGAVADECSSTSGNIVSVQWEAESVVVLCIEIEECTCSIITVLIPGSP